MSDTDIKILLSSDHRYEELVVEIFCGGKFVALLNQDDGKNEVKIEFPGQDVEESKVNRIVDLSTFERALAEAKGKLED